MGFEAETIRGRICETKTPVSRANHDTGNGTPDVLAVHAPLLAGRVEPVRDLLWDADDDVGLVGPKTEDGEVAREGSYKNTSVSVGASHIRRVRTYRVPHQRASRPASERRPSVSGSWRRLCHIS